MARVTHVKAAQQRYKMVDVLDADGRPTYTTVNRRRPTKSGAPTHRKRITKVDKTQPLPPLTCDHCHQPIEVGTAYKWVQTKSTYGGVRRNRHAGCPTWQPWDLSQSLGARIAQIQHDGSSAISAGIDALEDASDAVDLLEEAAAAAEELAEEKRESAQNIEDGFGHETETSQRLAEQAEELEAWAQQMRSVDVPDKPEPEEGATEEEIEEALAEWREDVTSALEDVLGDDNVSS